MLPSDGTLVPRNAVPEAFLTASHRGLTLPAEPNPLVNSYSSLADVRIAQGPKVQSATKTSGNLKEELGFRQKRVSSACIKESNSQDAKVEILKVDVTSHKTVNDLYISSNVYNRISEVNGQNKKQEYVIEKRKTEVTEDDISIGENIAGNNAGHFIPEEVLPLQYNGIPDGEKVSPEAITSTCPTCGEGSLNPHNGVCKQCMQRTKQADLRTGKLDELLAYAQFFALSFRKMLTMKGNNRSEDLDKTDLSEVSQLSEPSVKPDLTKYKGAVGDDRGARKFWGPTTPTPSICGDDTDTISMVDGDAYKDPRGRLERQASNLTSTDSRPPLSRGKTKLKAVYSASRTKTFRSTIGRSRTGHEIKNDPSTTVAFSRRSVFSESSRKSGRTQTFDSCNLPGRKGAHTESRLEVIQEGSSVDPPAHEDYKGLDKSHRYSLSRSATSPGTNVINKLKREKSSFGTAMPLMRTNTKLTLRANKAAVLRMETVQKSNTLFHQPNVEENEGSPILERKRFGAREYSDNVKPKHNSVVMERRIQSNRTGDIQVQAGSKGEPLTASEELTTNLQDRSHINNKVEPAAEEVSSEIYCLDKNYVKAVEPETDPQQDIAVPVSRQQYDAECAETSPYCDDLHHYGKSLEDQLVVGNVSTMAVTPYFDKEKELAREDVDFYTEAAVKENDGFSSSKERISSQLYSIEGVGSKSSTHLRDVTRVRSSLSYVGTSRASMASSANGSHSRRQVKYSETDVDSGTIYHMARRIASDQKVASHGEFTAGFFEIGGNVSKSSSSISGGHSSVALDTEYTGGFFGEHLNEDDKKNGSKSSSNSETPYCEYEGTSKFETIDANIYTGSVFSSSANNLALGGVYDNWKNMSTNNSNRLPCNRCRSRTTKAHVNNRRILNCSNNSNSSVERARSPSSDNRGPTITQSDKSSYLDYAGYSRPKARPVNVSFNGTLDFTKYDNLTMNYSTPCQNAEKPKESVYELGTYRFGHAFNATPQRSEKLTDDWYTPGRWNTNANNNTDGLSTLNANNNYFGDFYTDGDSSPWRPPQQERRPPQSAASSSEFTSNPSPKYAPGSFYENAYSGLNKSPPRAQPQTSLFGTFNGYGEPASLQEKQRVPSPEYAGSFSYGSVMETRSRSPPAASLYESYSRTSSQSPKRQSWEQDGYFGYHAAPRDERGDTLDLAGKSPVSAIPKIKRVGAIICRENVANKDDYAEDVNRDLMEDPWVPISYRLAAEQVKEMGGGRCSSKEFFKASEARCDTSLMDQSPFVQGQIMETLGRRTSGWNLKNNTDSLRDDISMKWRDAREKGSPHHKRSKKSSLESVSSRSSHSSVWRPNDHIPAKARGNRILTKSEPKGPTLLDESGNTNNSRVWSAVMWVPSTVGSYVKKLW